MGEELVDKLDQASGINQDLQNQLAEANRELEVLRESKRKLERSERRLQHTVEDFQASQEALQTDLKKTQADLASERLVFTLYCS